jgi:hypothetical protein
VGVLGLELAAAQRAARERAERVATDDARWHKGRRVVEGELQLHPRLFELDRHQGEDGTGWPTA